MPGEVGRNASRQSRGPERALIVSTLWLGSGPLWLINNTSINKDFNDSFRDTHTNPGGASA